MWTIDEPIVEKVEKTCELILTKVVMNDSGCISPAICSMLGITEHITEHFRIPFQKETLNFEKSTIHLSGGELKKKDKAGLDTPTTNVTVPSSK